MSFALDVLDLGSVVKRVFKFRQVKETAEDVDFPDGSARASCNINVVLTSRAASSLFSKHRSDASNHCKLYTSTCRTTVEIALRKTQETQSSLDSFWGTKLVRLGRMAAKERAPAQTEVRERGIVRTKGI
jgi:hypothetical protein